jgi:hypothetical protein
VKSVGREESDAMERLTRSRMGQLELSTTTPRRRRPFTEYMCLEIGPGPALVKDAEGNIILPPEAFKELDLPLGASKPHVKQAYQKKVEEILGRSEFYAAFLIARWLLETSSFNEIDETNV